MSDNRKEYEMTKDDQQELLSHMQPRPVMYISGGQQFGSNQQDNANNAWKVLGDKMGFDGMTVKPVQGKSGLFFTAIPTMSDTPPVAEKISRNDFDEMRSDMNIEGGIQACPDCNSYETHPHCGCRCRDQHRYHIMRHHHTCNN